MKITDNIIRTSIILTTKWEPITAITTSKVSLFQVAQRLVLKSIWLTNSIHLSSKLSSSILAVNPTRIFSQLRKQRVMQFSNSPILLKFQVSSLLNSQLLLKLLTLKVLLMMLINLPLLLLLRRRLLLIWAWPNQTLRESNQQKQRKAQKSLSPVLNQKIGNVKLRLSSVASGSVVLSAKTSTRSRGVALHTVLTNSKGKRIWTSSTWLQYARTLLRVRLNACMVPDVSSNIHPTMLKKDSPTAKWCKTTRNTQLWGCFKTLRGQK